MRNEKQTEVQKISTGIEGLDEILYGGLPRGELYLVQGDPGTGKTILGLKFLMAGISAGETCLFITSSQRKKSLTQTANSLGWSLEGIRIHELSFQTAIERAAAEQVVIDPSDMEMEELMREIIDIVERESPDRVVFDSISYLRMLANNATRYRRQFLLLRNYFIEHKATVYLTDDQDLRPVSGELQALVHGVVFLNQTPGTYGTVRRTLYVVKLRGTGYQGGVHDFTIDSRGIRVFPRLPRTVTQEKAEWRMLSSGISELDKLIGGGLAEGTSCLITGPSGTGKSTVASVFLAAAASRGESSAVFLFDELPSTFIHRTESLGISNGEYFRNGRISLHYINTAEHSPGEFAYSVRKEVSERDVKIVLIDTLTGYMNSMPNEKFLITQMHDLLSYLNRQGVLTILVVAQHGFIGKELEGPIDISYLADTVLLIRHFETQGMIRQAISAYKKRYGSHEKYLREIRISADKGVTIGQPLTQFSGVLGGTPVYTGQRETLLEKKDEPQDLQ